MAKLEMQETVRGESHKTVRPDWIGHSCTKGTYRILFGILRSGLPPRTAGGDISWEPVQECEIVLDDDMLEQLRDLLAQLRDWYQEPTTEGPASSAAAAGCPPVA